MTVNAAAAEGPNAADQAADDDSRRREVGAHPSDVGGLCDAALPAEAERPCREEKIPDIKLV